MKTTFTLNEVERMGWLPPAKAKDLERYRAALEQIRDGFWNVGTGKNLSPREFARAALASVRARTPARDGAAT